MMPKLFSSSKQSAYPYYQETFQQLKNLTICVQRWIDYSQNDGTRDTWVPTKCGDHKEEMIIN